MPRKFRVINRGAVARAREARAVSKIQAFIRNKRKSKPRAITRAPSGGGGGNSYTLKCRVPFEILYSQMSQTTNAAGVPYDDSIQFTFLNAPWRNLQTTAQNRLYDEDFTRVLPMYQRYRLSRVDYHIRRPKQFYNQVTNTDIITKPCVDFGTQILHTRVINAANATTNVIEGSVNIQPRIETTIPVSWKESIDNQSSRFKVHGYKTYVKRTWLPIGFEKKNRNRDITSDQDLACGGLHIRLKDKTIIPDLGSSPAGNQVMFEGFADVYMTYSSRT